MRFHKKAGTKKEQQLVCEANHVAYFSTYLVYDICIYVDLPNYGLLLLLLLFTKPNLRFTKLWSTLFKIS